MGTTYSKPKVEAEEAHPELNLVPLEPAHTRALTLPDHRTLCDDEIETQVANSSNATRQRIFGQVPVADDNPFALFNGPRLNERPQEQLRDVARLITPAYSAENPGEEGKNNGFKMV